MPTKLHQIVAVESGIKSDTNREVTDLYRDIQKDVLVNGMARTYEKRYDDGDDLPDEIKNVQLDVEDAITAMSTAMTRLFDIEFTKDSANTEAKADVVVDGVPLITDAPVPFLLFLEKHLTQVRDFVDKIPVLDPAERWTVDEAIGVWVSDPATTVKTKRVPRNHVVAPATDKHPAQVQVYNEDIPIGDWTIRKFSGAMAKPRKDMIMARIVTLQTAVKFAREQANEQEVTDRIAGDAIFDYLFTA